VSILPGQDYNGVCAQPGVPGYYYSTWRECQSIARADIVSACAGMPAQRLVDPDAPDFHGDSDDNAALRVSCQYHLYGRRCRIEGDDGHKAYLNTLRAEAGRLVRKQRKAIAKLAELLLQRKELEGAEAEQLIEPLLVR
jgi:hypothetical protein